MYIFKFFKLGNCLMLFFLITSFLGGLDSLSQTHFKSDLRNANPVDEKSTLSIEEKLKVHNNYLDKAISEKNVTQQFYGHLFLFVDYYKKHNYVDVNRQLNQADSIANESGSLSWQGAIYMRKGTMSDALNSNYEESIEYYKKAVALCLKAKDSLCVAESLEQISSMYGFLEKYDTAHYYFRQALPILEKFADKQQIALTYNNYSNLLSFEKKFSEALLYVDSAIFIARANKDPYKEMMYLNNKGAVYAGLGDYDQAIEIYQSCVEVNKKNQWIDLLVNNYIGLFEAFEKKGNYRLAFEYLKTFYLFKDSVTGNEVQLKTAELNTKFEIQAKELALEKSQLALTQADQSLTKRNFFIGFLLVVAVSKLILWGILWQKKKIKLRQNQENLQALTRMLLEKNTQLVEMEEQLAVDAAIKNQAPESIEFESNLTNQRILTDTDWISFKNYFEKAHPGYLLRLRTVHPTFTEAEQRLFIFIKLNLKSKETAAILGISPDSVKKARNRLRKRLQLNEDMQLDDFIHDF